MCVSTQSVVKRDLHAFQGGRRHHGRFGTPEEEKGGGGAGEATAGESVLATVLWGMLYADDAGVVFRSPEQLRKMLELIVVVCAAFGLTVSEAKTQTMLFFCTSRTVSYARELTSVYMRNSQGDGFNISLSRLLPCSDQL